MYISKVPSHYVVHESWTMIYLGGLKYRQRHIAFITILHI